MRSRLLTLRRIGVLIYAICLQVAVLTPFPTAQGLGWGIQSPQGFTAVTPTEPQWVGQGWVEGYRAIGPGANAVLPALPLGGGSGLIQLPADNAAFGPAVGENLDGINVE
jgi:hypothetical protein